MPLARVRLYLLPNANITHNFKKILIRVNFSKYAHLCFVCSSLSYHNNEVKRQRWEKRQHLKILTMRVSNSMSWLLCSKNRFLPWRWGKHDRLLPGGPLVGVDVAPHLITRAGWGKAWQCLRIAHSWKWFRWNGRWYMCRFCQFSKIKGLSQIIRFSWTRALFQRIWNDSEKRRQEH